MRDSYHLELDEITNLLVEMTRLVSSAMQRTSTALLDADLALAETVIDGDQAIDAVYLDIEKRSFELLARQQPVASDLRVIVTSLRMVADLERSGDLALHLAKLARRRYPECAVPVELRPAILEMAQVAERIITKTGTVIATRDIDQARELESDDDVMDELHRELFTVMLADDWSHGVETAIDIALAGRYFERFADHAVSVARRVVYLVTGERD
ncbi:MAG: phosphate signaling complex protein PhoU [Actinomycetota bacterium]|nr:phosphate signaling complex protein PhoU [Actinomycetota bacterium]